MLVEGLITCMARKWSTVTSRVCAFVSLYRSSSRSLVHLKANILIDHWGHACIADFGLLTILSNQMGFISSISHEGGSVPQWMSPELLDPGKFGLKESSNKESDYYGLGMVVCEVLSGRLPFPQCKVPIIILKVMNGEHPGRPQGVRGAWFTEKRSGGLDLSYQAVLGLHTGLGLVIRARKRLVEIRDEVERSSSCSVFLGEKLATRALHIRCPVFSAYFFHVVPYRE